jgi:heme exporter protein D
MSAPQAEYTQEEVNEIIRRALGAQAIDERVLSHAELVEIAAESGIEREALERATAELAQARTQELARQVESRAIAAERTVQLKRFGASVVSYSILNGFLYLIASRFTGGTWYVWPLLGSGALLALQVRHVIFPHDKILRNQRREEKRRERERRRAARAAWKHKVFEGGDVVAQGAKEFETVVQSGVTALLKIAARKLEDHVEREESRRRDRGR